MSKTYTPQQMHQVLLALLKHARYSFRDIDWKFEYLNGEEKYAIENKETMELIKEMGDFYIKQPYLNNNSEKDASTELATKVNQYLQSKGHEVKQDENYLSVDIDIKEMNSIIKELKENKKEKDDGK